MQTNEEKFMAAVADFDLIELAALAYTMRAAKEANDKQEFGRFMADFESWIREYREGKLADAAQAELQAV